MILTIFIIFSQLLLDPQPSSKENSIYTPDEKTAIEKENYSLQEFLQEFEAIDLPFELSFDDISKDLTHQIEKEKLSKKQASLKKKILPEAVLNKKQQKLRQYLSYASFSRMGYKNIQAKYYYETDSKQIVVIYKTGFSYESHPNHSEYEMAVLSQKGELLSHKNLLYNYRSQQQSLSINDRGIITITTYTKDKENNLITSKPHSQTYLKISADGLIVNHGISEDEIKEELAEFLNYFETQELPIKFEKEDYNNIDKNRKLKSANQITTSNNKSKRFRTMGISNRFDALAKSYIEKNSERRKFSRSGPPKYTPLLKFPVSENTMALIFNISYTFGSSQKGNIHMALIDNRGQIIPQVDDNKHEFQKRLIMDNHKEIETMEISKDGMITVKTYEKKYKFDLNKVPYHKNEEIGHRFAGTKIFQILPNEKVNEEIISIDKLVFAKGDRL